ncbi:MAG TPA: DUF4190 domain-containing protein [Mycobacterium sp.]|nr:DUF4190 domain-containing protein [Mycobacterium sp.]
MTWPSGDPNQPQGASHQPYQQPRPPPPPPMPYQQAPYGGPYPQQPYEAPKKTSPWAIAALILGIIGAILFSVICGIVALNKTKNGQEGGRGLAIAGLVLSGLWAVGAAVLVALFFFVAKDNVVATDLKVGDCITEVPTSTKVLTLPTTECSQPHGGEVYAVLTMPDGSYPGASAIDEWQNKCPEELQSFSPEAMADDSVGVFVLYPTQETWDQGDRAITCIATLEPKRAGSIKG